MMQEHLLSFGYLELLDSYGVITCNEGVHIDFNEIQEMGIVLHPVLQENQFGLIANRVNQYSVNPLAIKKLFSDECLVAGAIVGSSYTTRLNAEIENEIVDVVPIGYFTNMSSAKKWIMDMTRKNSKN